MTLRELRAQPGSGHYYLRLKISERNEREQATSEFSRFSNLLSKLRRVEEVKCEAALIGMKNGVQWW